MTFKRRLSLSIVLLVLTLVGLLSLVYLRYVLRMQVQFVLQQAEMVARQIESATLEAIRSETAATGFVSPDPERSRAFWRRVVSEDEQLPEILQAALGSYNRIAEIALTDAEGHVLVGSMGRQRWVDRPPLRELMERGFVQQLRSLSARQQDYEVSLRLADQEKAVLAVHVAVSTALLRKELEPQIRGLGLVALAGLLVSLGLAILFSRLVFRPLDRLSEAIDRMTRGELSATPEAAASGGDEYTAISSKLSLLGQQFRDAREGISSLRGNMEQLMRKLEDAVLLFDQDDRLIIAGAAAEAYLGMGRWQMMGRQLEEIFPANTQLGALVVSAVRLRQPIEDRLVELSTGPEGAPEGPSRRPARALLSVELMEDFANPRRLGALVSLRDAETRRELTTQVEVSNRLAAISRLTSGVAHEIKNPLNAITLHLELLKNRLGSEPENPPELEVIAREIARLDRVVKTFLDFTRPVELHLANVRLDGLLEEVAALASPEAAEHQVRIRVQDGCPEAVVKADRDLLKQAVLNLAVNGIQAMPSGGELSLGLARAGSEAEVSVVDQGEGIPSEIRDKIFRLHFTTKKRGSGIGLAMAFRVVQLHNGTIDFSSELGRGTTFRMRFPLVEA